MLRDQVAKLEESHRRLAEEHEDAKQKVAGLPLKFRRKLVPCTCQIAEWYCEPTSNKSPLGSDDDTIANPIHSRPRSPDTHDSLEHELPEGTPSEKTLVTSERGVRDKSVKSGAKMTREVLKEEAADSIQSV